MAPEFKHCDFCRHTFRIQLGPHFWRHDCRLNQVEYPHAADCNAYQPPPLPEFRECGLGYVWDGEYEGAA